MKNIACLVTPNGDGGIASIQVSGPSAFQVLDAEFQGKTNQKNTPGKLRYGCLYQDSQHNLLVDEVVLNYIPASRSFTGQDILEINCHGGVAAINAIFDILQKKQIQRVTSQQFLQNYSLTQNQKQILQLLISSQTEFVARMLLYQFNGALQQKLQQLIPLIHTSPDLVITELLDIQHTYHLVNNCIHPQKLVIAGRPNAGKSTLLNYFSGRERTIVDHTPGTTRDAISVPIAIRGIPFVVTDTAGMRSTQEQIESMGIEVAKRMLQQADYVLWVIDAATTPEKIDFPQHSNIIIVLNKCDLTPNHLEHYLSLFPKAVQISAVNKQGITAIEDLLIDKYKKFVSNPEPFVAIITQAIYNEIERAIAEIRHQNYGMAQEILQGVE